jgi:hypothetical protein
LDSSEWRGYHIRESSSQRPHPSEQAEGEPMTLPEVVVYADAYYGGNEWRTNLNYSNVGSDWNDEISSIIVVSGTWVFYSGINYMPDDTVGWPVSAPLTPGYYPWVEAEPVIITNDSISSFKCIDRNPV